MPNVYKKNPANQTNDEWIQEYSGSTASIVHKPEVPAWKKQNSDRAIYEFHYVDHRTTRHGCVVMEFETLDYKFKAIHFFNVNISGRNGKRYPSGDRGQFNPPKKGKFRCFWMRTVGKNPSRWSRVHRTMRSSLRGITFEGTVKEEKNSKGEGYFKITNIWRV